MFKILFREDKHTHDEYDACVKHFGTDVIRYRHEIKKGDTILGRYSVLPFYHELDDECKSIGAKLVNSFNQHKYIADMKDWVLDLEDLTPKTWMLSDLHNGYMSIPDTEFGYFIKGATNSKKHLWNTHARAKTKNDIGGIVSRLREDLFLEGQDIAIREFVPLKVLEEGISGLPMANEYRFFFFKGYLIAEGFYWSIINEMPDILPPVAAYDIAVDASEILKDKVNAYVIDVAEKVDGKWIVVEVNDFQMSGLSTINPNSFYRDLKEITENV